MKTKVREKANWPVTILLILGLITVVFPLYMTIVIAYIQAADRDDQQCSRDPVSAREIQSCQFQGSYGGNRLLAFSWKQSSYYRGNCGIMYINTFTCRLSDRKKDEAA